MIDCWSILEYLIKTLIIGGAILGISALIKVWTEKHTTRFSRLHNERGEVIKQLYSKLVRMEKSLRVYMHPIQQVTQEEIDKYKKFLLKDAERRKTAVLAARDFIWYYDENRIFFTENICDLIERLYEVFRKEWIHFHIFGDDDMISKIAKSQKSKLQIDAYNRIEQEIPELRRQLECEFRKLLGVRS